MTYSYIYILYVITPDLTNCCLISNGYLLWRYLHLNLFKLCTKLSNYKYTTHLWDKLISLRRYEMINTKIYRFEISWAERLNPAFIIALFILQQLTGRDVKC